MSKANITKIVYHCPECGEPLDQLEESYDDLFCHYCHYSIYRYEYIESMIHAFNSTEDLTADQWRSLYAIPYGRTKLIEEYQQIHEALDEAQRERLYALRRLLYDTRIDPPVNRKNFMQLCLDILKLWPHDRSALDALHMAWSDPRLLFRNPFEPEEEAIAAPQPTFSLHFELVKDRKSYAVMDLGACMDTRIVIPAAYKGLPVTTIGEKAFCDCGCLKSISLPDSITTIQNEAFAECTGLSELIIPPSVTGIGDAAFRGCKDLTELILPDSVESIGKEAFVACARLQTLTLPCHITGIESRICMECTALTDMLIPDN